MQLYKTERYETIVEVHTCTGCTYNLTGLQSCEVSIYPLDFTERGKFAGSGALCMEKVTITILLFFMAEAFFGV